jgi:hypothetical protein
MTAHSRTHPSACGTIVDVLRQEATALSGICEAIEQGGPVAHQWEAAIGMIDSCQGHVVVSGMGKSGLVGAKISATLSSVGIPSHVVHPADAVHGDLGAIRSGDVVMLLSYSGGTPEVVELAAILRNDGVRRLGISRGEETQLARLWTAQPRAEHIDDGNHGMRRRAGTGRRPPPLVHCHRLSSTTPGRITRGDAPPRRRTHPIPSRRESHDDQRGCSAG